MGGRREEARAHGRRLALTCLVAAGAACGSDEPAVTADDAVRRDSAGIPVAETPLASIPRVTLGNVVLSIGATEGPPGHELYDVRSPWLGEDGRLILANSGTRELRVYERDGTLLRSVGGQGDGPGEYQMIAWVRPWHGDSLAVSDGFTGRLTILDDEGAVGRTLRLQPAGGTAPPDGGAGTGPAVGGLGGASAVDVFPDGRFIGKVGGASAAPGDTTAVLAVVGSYRVFDADGREVTRIADILDGESFRFVSGDSRSVGPLPFGKSSAVASLERTVDGAVMALADGSRFGVLWLAADGAVRRIGQVPVPAEPLTDRMKAAYRERRLAQLATLPDFARAAQTAMLEATPYPENVPLHGRMVVGGGHVWLERFREPGSERPGEWIAFESATGRATARLTLPAGTELASVRGDTAVVIATDELGVQRVIVAPIVR
ncbi:MAG: hypothetical protein PVF05_03160 [Gemmatimonadales bacterium]